MSAMNRAATAIRNAKFLYPRRFNGMVMHIHSCNLSEFV